MESLKELGRGTYTLVIKVNEDLKIVIGKLGSIMFYKGIYCYIGSALGPSNLSLYMRVNRHLNKVKKLKWHIDYLTSHEMVSIIAIIAAKTQEKFECKIASLINKSNKAIPIVKFGSTDCRCISHLYYFKNMHEDEVIKLIANIYSHLGLLPKIISLK